MLTRTRAMPGSLTERRTRRMFMTSAALQVCHERETEVNAGSGSAGRVLSAITYEC
jgi:hypothetical protein